MLKTPSPLNVLIVDDHRLFVAGLMTILHRLPTRLAVTEVDRVEALGEIAPISPDMVLLDLNLPGVSGRECVRRVVERFPHANIILLTGSDDAKLVADCLAAGARAYIHKSSPPENLLATLRGLIGSIGGATTEPPAELNNRLSPRQQEVLTMLCNGLSNKEIAREMGVTDHTIRGHLAGIYRLFGVSTRTKAVLIAKKLGLD